jgi:hypothetical protein
MATRDVRRSFRPEVRGRGRPDRSTTHPSEPSCPASQACCWSAPIRPAIHVGVAGSSHAGLPEASRGPALVEPGRTRGQAVTRYAPSHTNHSHSVFNGTTLRCSQTLFANRMSLAFNEGARENSATWTMEHLRRECLDRLYATSEIVGSLTVAKRNQGWRVLSVCSK